MVLTLANVYFKFLYVLYILLEIIKCGHNVTVKKPGIEEQQ